MDTELSYQEQIDADASMEIKSLVRTIAERDRKRGYAITSEGKIDPERFNRKGVIRRSVAWCLEKLGKRKTD